jgi:biotin-dependent carboxylase-like uncharacterized protein
VKGSGALEVLRTGALATVQDLGRPGYAHLGVSGSGAADRGSLRLANRLVGNPESAAGIEVVLGGFAVRLLARPAVVAVTGARCSVRADGRLLAMDSPLQLSAETVLELGAPEAGLRTYLAVRGGLDVAAVLGSRSTDTLSGLGPDALTEGVELPVGSDELEAPSVDIAPQPHPPAELVLGVRVGPRDDWFADGAVDQLCSTGWQVSSDTDRVGIRLDGEPLERRGDGELKSEAMVRGSIQVPRGGRPIVFGADHPVTGGYPVIAVVDGDDMDLAAQARPGQTLRFRAR